MKEESITIRLPPRTADLIESQVNEGQFSSRKEALEYLLTALFADDVKVDNTISHKDLDRLHEETYELYIK